ncbi:Dyp-type peroxidase [Thermobispora bispora]|nr:Dyp-type peroxidase [Thermobispora bispora]
MPEQRPNRVSRRGFLGGTAAAVAAMAACSPRQTASTASSGPSPAGEVDWANEPFHGVHQAGIATIPQTYGTFVAFDLRPKTGRTELQRLMRLLTDDARRLTQGVPALADSDPELAAPAARLTITFGFGPGVFSAVDAEDQAPPALRLPSFSIDRLEKKWSGGDLLVQACADDRLTLAHAVRVIVKDARAFATVRWVQHGFRRPPSTQPLGTTQRNLFGQLDGTVNPRPGTPEFDRAVWVSDGPEWLRGGTTLVLRRIRMHLETWDELDREGKEFAIGRRLSDGAPLTGGKETDEPDFSALTPAGFPVISEMAHIRRAHVADPGMRILRRPYNYDEGITADGRSDAGLLFAAYQASIERQFIPIQRRLAEADLLNQWTTPIGSAAFAIPPGCGPDGWIGETLLG